MKLYLTIVEFLETNNPIQCLINYSLISFLKNVLVSLKAKIIIRDLQSLKIATTPLNAFIFKAKANKQTIKKKKKRQIPIGNLHSKLKDLVLFRKKKIIFPSERKEELREKAPHIPACHVIMHHCLNTIKIASEFTWGFSAELQKLAHQSQDIQMEESNPLYDQLKDCELFLLSSDKLILDVEHTNTSEKITESCTFTLTGISNIYACLHTYIYGNQVRNYSKLLHYLPCLITPILRCVYL